MVLLGASVGRAREQGARRLLWSGRRLCGQSDVLVVCEVRGHQARLPREMRLIERHGEHRWNETEGDVAGGMLIWRRAGGASEVDHPVLGRVAHVRFRSEAGSEFRMLGVPSA